MIDAGIILNNEDKEPDVHNLILVNQICRASAVASHLRMPTFRGCHFARFACEGFVLKVSGWDSLGSWQNKSANHNL